MDKQATARDLIVMRRRCKSQEDFFEQEFTKGEAVGLRMASALPQTLLDVGTLNLPVDTANEEGS